MSTFYTIRPNMSEPVLETISFERVRAYVTELSGRSLGQWFVQSLHRNGRVYVATAPGSRGRQLYGKGFIVSKVVES